ncbi:DUF4339 domain-containing protein [Pseudomonas sp. MAFF 302046]|uniref:DUF4339 domain-containing protein n=1 Tax=Pseudomonas morbosilactucae TaxID=2938197 RepID=A0ABT0JAN6_9PSED|nr:DUF4339 domain-containing protein [Pseudomonas morbosilactucae]MCK9812963.1 DUF4339 domain-containing protein [Pseudomonas morbosilactucae]
MPTTKKNSASPRSFFAEGWLENLLKPVAAPFAGQAPAAPGFAAPPPMAGGALPPPVAAVQYSYHLNVAGTNYGPYTSAQLQQYVQTGQVTRDSMLWREGMAAWLSAGQIQELAHLFAPAAGSPPPLGGPAMPPPL